MKDYQLDGNKEMVALGSMNLVGSLTSCYVATGSGGESWASMNLPKTGSFFLSMTKSFHSFSRVLLEIGRELYGRLPDGGLQYDHVLGCVPDPGSDHSPLQVHPKRRPLFDHHIGGDWADRL